MQWFILPQYLVEPQHMEGTRRSEVDRQIGVLYLRPDYPELIEYSLKTKYAGKNRPMLPYKEEVLALTVNSTVFLNFTAFIYNSLVADVCQNLEIQIELLNVKTIAESANY